MNYTETLDFLFSQLPMFQRVGGAAYKVDLSNTVALCNMIGNPQEKLKFVHIAGTNGKGSTSHMIAAVLQAAGYKTGLYTSPHLKDFRERIRVNGQVIPQEAVVKFVHEYKNKWSEISPSFFEITVAMSFWYFLEEDTDVVVLETGMGGRLDSTNIVRPEVTAITSIGLDHTQFLGTDIPSIAAEKAGIIKTGIPVVTGDVVPEAMEVIRATASAKKAPLIESTSIEVEVPPTDLKGPFQLANSKTAFTMLKELRKRGYSLSLEHVIEGFSQVAESTGLMGRWQQLSAAPLTITDCAHNAEGLQVVIDEIAKQEFHNLHIVLGVSNDKALEGILPLFPKEAMYYFCQANIPRAMTAESLKLAALEYDLKGEYFPSVRKAYEAARLYATKKDLIYIGGSVFVVAEVV